MFVGTVAVGIYARRARGWRRQNGIAASHAVIVHPGALTRSQHFLVEHDFVNAPIPSIAATGVSTQGQRISGVHRTTRVTDSTHRSIIDLNIERIIDRIMPGNHRVPGARGNRLWAGHCGSRCSVAHPETKAAPPIIQRIIPQVLVVHIAFVGNHHYICSAVKIDACRQRKVNITCAQGGIISSRERFQICGNNTSSFPL